MFVSPLLFCRIKLAQIIDDEILLVWPIANKIGDGYCQQKPTNQQNYKNRKQSP